MKTFGLIGKKLGHSFSPGYFKAKFEREGIEGCEYNAYELSEASFLKELIEEEKVKGLNVTIPYKQEVIPLLDELNETAEAIGAVNTIAIKEDKLIGFNTDVIGFQSSLEPLLKGHHKRALILGTGGASKAVQFVMEQLGIDFIFVSRTASDSILSYEALKEFDLADYPLIINTTPLGMYPNIDEAPDLNYNQISAQHLLFDLIYNPEETLFLKMGKEKGAQIKNGLEMLHLQAEAAWMIWNA